MSDDCIFCKIAKKEIPTEFVKETPNIMVFNDINPQVKGHLLIVPKTHYQNLIDLPMDVADEMISVTKKIAKEQIGGDVEGFNIIMNNFPVAGQLVMHAHIHFLPRRKKDSFRLKL